MFFGRGFTLRACTTAMCNIAFMLFGYDQGVLSSVVSNPDFLNVIGNPNDVVLGVIVACYNLGCATGAILTFCLCEKLGRRWSIWLAMVFISIGAVLQASAFSQAHFVVGRVICGIGTGIDSSTVPLYQAELSHSNSRGRLISSELIFVSIGIQVAYWFNYGMSLESGPQSWRLPIAFQLVFAIITIIMVFGVPESPRYLCKIGRSNEGLEVLSAVWNLETDHPQIIEEHRAILDALALEREHGEYRWLQLHKADSVRTRRRLLLCVLIYAMNQLSGINVLVYYLPTVLQVNIGLSSQMAQVIGGCANLMLLVGNVASLLTADKLGRRRPAIWGSIGLGTCMILVAILLSFSGKGALGHATANGSIVFFFLYNLIFALSLSIVPWTYGPEILPLQVRAKGNAFAVTTLWLWNFLVVMITPVLVHRIKWATYLLFGCLCFAFVPILYFLFPETKDLTLEEIDRIFTQGTSPIKASSLLRAEKKAGTHLEIIEGLALHEKRPIAAEKEL